MPINYSELVNLPVGTVVCIVGKNPFDAAQIVVLNNMARGDNGITLIGVDPDSSLEPGITECRFLIAPLFKADSFIRYFGARLKELTITKYENGCVSSSTTQTDSTPDLPAARIIPPKINLSASAAKY